jgi:hypothetical protein
MKRLLVVGVTAVLLAAGCGAGGDDTAGTPAGGTGPAATASGEAEPLLAAYGLAGKDAVQIVDQLDRLALTERPTGLRASVRPDALVLSAGTTEVTLDIPGDRFYLSVAPYVNRTHECFHHSLTTCKGELAGRELAVTIVDRNGTVLVDGARTTFDNGFVGFWLPRNIDAVLRISYDGRTAEAAISTGPSAPTCLTTLRLA